VRPAWFASEVEPGSASGDRTIAPRWTRSGIARRPSGCVRPRRLDGSPPHTSGRGDFGFTSHSGFAVAADGPAPRIASRQQYIEFTLEGASSDVRPADLALYANDRLVSLRKTRLVKIADEGGRATYRLLGIPHVSSARATFTFVVNGPGSGASTTWRRG
jgi:hypothetical protein